MLEDNGDGVLHEGVGITSLEKSAAEILLNSNMERLLRNFRPVKS